MVNSMILVTGTGDHDRPEWLITINGSAASTAEPPAIGDLAHSLLVLSSESGLTRYDLGGGSLPDPIPLINQSARYW
jgi:hypothetical protein